MATLSYDIAKDCAEFVSKVNQMASLASSIRAKLPGKHIHDQKRYLRNNVKQHFEKLMCKQKKLSPTTLQNYWELLYRHIFGTYEKKCMRRRDRKANKVKKPEILPSSTVNFHPTNSNLST